MIHAELDKRKGLLIVEPHGPLTADDFRSVAAIVDPYIADKAVLRGLLIRAPTFPGWDGFGALTFPGWDGFGARDRAHEVRAQPSARLERVAAVTDSDFLRIAPAIAGHLLQPEIRVFPATRRPRRCLASDRQLTPPQAVLALSSSSCALAPGDHAGEVARQHHHVEAALDGAAAKAALAQCMTHLMPALWAAARILSQVAMCSGSGLSPRGGRPSANDRSAGPM